MKIGTVGNILVTVKEIELIEPYLKLWKEPSVSLWDKNNLCKNNIAIGVSVLPSQLIYYEYGNLKVFYF
jgi:hypothetical protein